MSLQTDVQLAAAGVAAAAGLYFFYSSKNQHDVPPDIGSQGLEVAAAVGEKVKEHLGENAGLAAAGVVALGATTLQTMANPSQPIDDDALASVFFSLVPPDTPEEFAKYHMDKWKPEIFTLIGHMPNPASDEDFARVRKDFHARFVLGFERKPAGAAAMMKIFDEYLAAKRQTDVTIVHTTLLQKISLDTEMAIKQVLDAPTDRLARASRIMYERNIDNNTALSAAEKANYKTKFETKIAAVLAERDRQSEAVKHWKLKLQKERIDTATRKYARTVSDEATAEAIMSKINTHSSVDDFNEARVRLTTAKAQMALAKANLDKIKAELGQ